MRHPVISNMQNLNSSSNSTTKATLAGALTGSSLRKHSEYDGGAVRTLGRRAVFRLEGCFFSPPRSLNVNGEFFRSDAEVSCDLYGAGGHVQSRLLADRATPSPSVFRRSCARQLTSVYSAAVPPCSGVDKKEVIPSSSRRRCTKQSNRDFYDECERPMAM